MFFRLATEKNQFTKVTTAAYGNEMHLYNYLSQQKRDKYDALQCVAMHCGLQIYLGYVRLDSIDFLLIKTLVFY